MGKGFDPRMNLGIETVLAAGGSGKREVTLVEFDEGDDSPSKAYADLIIPEGGRNRVALDLILDGVESLVLDVRGRGTADRSTTNRENG